MELCIYQDKVVAHQRMGRLEGMLQTMLPEIADTPKIQWHGTKIPKRLWERIKSFMTWTQGEYHSEAQIRLYYNDLTNRWRALAWPQYIGTGMFSEEIEGNHDNKARLMPLIDVTRGWYEFGTVHHHCTASAFQSGTDHKDEIDRPGIHITLGHVLSDVMSIHARFVTKKIQYEVDLSEWIDGNQTSSSEAPFPRLWADQCFKKPLPVWKPWKPRAGFGNHKTTYRYDPIKGYVDMVPEPQTPSYRRDWSFANEEDLETPPRITLPKTQIAPEDLDSCFEESLEGLDNSITESLERLITNHVQDVQWALDDIEWDNGKLTKQDRYRFARLAITRLSDWLETEAQAVLESDELFEEEVEEEEVEPLDELAGYAVGP